MYKYVIGVLLVTVLFVATGYISYSKGIEIEGAIAAEEVFQKLKDISRKNGFDFDWFQ